MVICRSADIPVVGIVLVIKVEGVDMRVLQNRNGVITCQ